jgi:hypothetical protein
LSGTPTQTGTFSIIVTATDANACFGNGTTYSLVIGCPTSITGTIGSTTTVVQNPSTFSTITFTGSGGIANYIFTYSINGGATQTVSSTGGSNNVTVQQSNATTGTFTYTLLSVRDANGCTGTITAPASATITVNSTGAPDLTVSQIMSTTHIQGPGVYIYELIAIRNVGTAPTSGPIEFTVTNYTTLTGLTVAPVGPWVTSMAIGFNTYPLSNANWTSTSSETTLTFISNPGFVINPGVARYIGVVIYRSGGARGSVTQTVTLTNGTGGDTISSNNSITNIIFKK